MGTVDLKVVLREHFEVNLMLVKFVVFPGVVLDDPFLHCSLRGDDRWGVVIVELCVQRIRLDGASGASRSHASGGVDEKRGSILNLFEEHGARERWCHVHNAAKPLLGSVQGGISGNPVVREWFVIVGITKYLHGEQRPRRSVVAKRPIDDVLRDQLS